MSVILRQKKGPSWRASATAMARMSILIRLFQFSAASSVILRLLGMRIKHQIGWLLNVNICRGKKSKSVLKYGHRENELGYFAIATRKLECLLIWCKIQPCIGKDMKEP